MSCDHYAHGIRHGKLADVAQPSLQIYASEGSYVLSVSNEGRDHACLVLDGLSAKVDGAPQKLSASGGRRDGKSLGGWGNYGPVDKTDSCEDAVFGIARSKDIAKKSNVVEVTDGATTLKMEIPNVLVDPIWSMPPPANAKPGDTLHVQITPPTMVDLAGYTAENDLSVSASSNPTTSVKLDARQNADHTIDLALPKTMPAGSYTLSIAWGAHSIPVISCGAAYCSAGAQFVLTAPIAIAP